MTLPLPLRPRLHAPLLALGGPGLLVLAAACGPRSVAVVGPVADAQEVAHALEAETRLDAPLRIVFGWQLREPDVRASGRGVARIEPPYKARLDLFRNGETVAKAALVDDDLRLPPGAPEDVLPPADLMWGVLGVFRPAAGTELVGGDRLEGGGVRLRYRGPDGSELHYHAREGRVEAVERVRGGHVVERVELEAADGRYPTDAVYRNLADYRELRMTRESLEDSAPYPPEIWYPMAAPAPEDGR